MHFCRRCLQFFMTMYYVLQGGWVAVSHAGERRWYGRRRGKHCHGKSIRPSSTFLFSSSELSPWLFWLPYNICRPKIPPIYPRTQLPSNWVYFNCHGLAKSNAATHLIAVRLQMSSGTPKFHQPWRSNPNSCSFRLRRRNLWDESKFAFIFAKSIL